LDKDGFGKLLGNLSQISGVYWVV